MTTSRRCALRMRPWAARRSRSQQQGVADRSGAGSPALRTDRALPGVRAGALARCRRRATPLATPACDREAPAAVLSADTPLAGRRPYPTWSRMCTRRNSRRGKPARVVSGYQVFGVSWFRDTKPAGFNRLGGASLDPARVSHARQACRLIECSFSGKRASPFSVFRDLMVSGYRACGLYWVRAHPASPARAPARPPSLRIGHVPSSRKRAFPISVFRVSLIYRKPARASAGSGCPLGHSAGPAAPCRTLPMIECQRFQGTGISWFRDFPIPGFRDCGVCGVCKKQS